MISPLLANIALDGMEHLLASSTKLRPYPVKTGKEAGRVTQKRVQVYGYVRYADDFIITAETKEELEAILPEVEAWLALRGLRLNQEKTHIRHITEGFNFLGFNIRRYGRKTLVKPQKEVDAPMMAIASLGGNALASWLGDWAKQRLQAAKAIDTEASLDDLARDLARALSQNAALASNVTQLLSETQAVTTAVVALQSQGDSQIQLLEQLLQGQTTANALTQQIADALNQVAGRSDLQQQLTERIEVMQQMIAGLRSGNTTNINAPTQNVLSGTFNGPVTFTLPRSLHINSRSLVRQIVEHYIDGPCAS